MWNATPALHFAQASQSPSTWRLASPAGVTNQRRRRAATAKLVAEQLLRFHYHTFPELFVFYFDRAVQHISARNP
ncbi:hypothetical protein M9458_029619, partial [Cirrhinus mrigala]